MKCDVRKYFQSIHHEVLFNKLKKENFDNDELDFLKLIIDSKNQETGVGLPIGNQTSQWFGLYYLDEIDRLIKEKLRNNMKLLRKLKQQGVVDEEYIRLRMNAFYAHICHSNAKSLYRKLKNANNL